jgi:acid stress chaperone HdeB
MTVGRGDFGKIALMKISTPLLLALFAFIAAPTARAQVTIDVAKITCDQYLTFSVTDPKNIAIWLSGYYHGKKGSTLVEPEEFKENIEKLKTACFEKANAKLPVMQIIEKHLGYGK